MYDFGILLHDLRKKKRMTQKQLADKLGVTVDLFSTEGQGTRATLTFPHDRTRKELFGA